MISSYTVGAQFEIVDRATPVLERLSKQLGEVARLASRTTAALEKLSGINLSRIDIGIKDLTATFKGLEGAVSASVTGMRDISKVTMPAKLIGEVDKLGKSFAALDKNATTGAAGATKAIGAIDASVSATVTSVGRLGAALTALNSGSHVANINSATTQAAQNLASQAQQSQPPKHPRPGRSGGAHFGAYGSTPIHGVHMQGDGVLGLMIGGWLGHELMKHSFAVDHVQKQMRLGGFKTKEIEDSTREAYRVGDKYGLPYERVLSDIKELRFPFGGVEHAVQSIEALEKMRVVLNSASEGKGNSARDAVYEMARAGELKGLNNMQDYVRYFDQMTKVIAATGGKVDPAAFMRATQYGRLSSMGFDEDFYTKYFPTLIQTMKPNQAGTALMSLSSSLVSGRMTKTAKAEMESLGAIGNDGEIVNKNLLVRNPFLWVKQVLTPLLEKQYGDVEHHQTEVIARLGKLFSNRTSAAAVGELALRMQSFERDKKIISNVPQGLDAAEGLLRTDPTAVIGKLKAAWENFCAALGGPLVDAAISGLNGISSAFTSMTKFLHENKDFGPAISQMTAAMVGLAVAVASLKLVASVFSGGLILKALQLAAAVVTLGDAFSKTELGKKINAVQDAILKWTRDFINAIPGFLNHVQDIILTSTRAMFNTIGEAFVNCIKALGKMITDTLSAIANFQLPKRDKDALQNFPAPNSKGNSTIDDGGVDLGLKGFKKMSFENEDFHNLIHKVAFASQAGFRDGTPKGVAAAAPRMSQAVSIAVSEGTLNGLLEASGNAAQIIGGWFKNAAAGALGAGGGAISNINFTPGGGGSFGGGGSSFGGGGGSIGGVGGDGSHRSGGSRRYSDYGGGGGGSIDTGPVAANRGAWGAHFNENASWFMRQFMRDYGVSKAVAAGPMGWMGGESGGDPTVVAPLSVHNGRVYGGDTSIFQWIGQRRNDLYRITGKHSANELTMRDAYKFMQWELANKFPGLVNRLRNAKTTAESFELWGKIYQGAMGTPAGWPEEVRRHAPWARRALGLDLGAASSSVTGNEWIDTMKRALSVAPRYHVRSLAEVDKDPDKQKVAKARKDAADASRRATQPPKATHARGQQDVYLDGHRVGRVLFPKFASMMKTPTAGSSLTDGTRVSTGPSQAHGMPVG